MEGRPVQSVEIGVTTTINGEETSLVYRKNVGLSPLSAGDFTFPIVVGDAEATYSWYIADAMCIDDK